MQRHAIPSWIMRDFWSGAALYPFSAVGAGEQAEPANGCFRVFVSHFPEVAIALGGVEASRPGLLRSKRLPGKRPDRTNIGTLPAVAATLFDGLPGWGEWCIRQ